MAVEKVISLVVDNKDAVKGIQQVDQEIKNVDQSSATLETQNKKTAKSTKGISNAVRGLGTALKAAGIGLVIALFAKLTELLSQNQKFTDTLSTAWSAFGIVVQDLFSIFEDGLPGITELGDAIKENLIERFRSLTEFYGLVGRGLKQLFEGDFAGAAETAEQAAKELVDVATGVDNSADKIANYASEVVKTADAYTQLTNQARLAEAQLRRVFEQSDRDAERQRRLRDNFNATAQERIEASERLAEILDKQEEVQLRLAGLEVQRARQAIKINGDNIDNQIALTNALAEQDAIEADIAGRRTEQEEQDRMLRKEIADERKKQTEDLINTDGLRLSTKKMTLAEEVAATRQARQKEIEIEQAKADAAIELAKKEKDAKMAAFDATAQAITNLAMISGQETVAGKALAIAASLISTYTGIAKSLEAGGFLGIAQSVAVGLAGFAAVKNIIDTKIPNEGKYGGGASGGGNVSQPAAPSFNIVGQSPVNQLAETLNQEQEPVQAFVVGSSVTTQQELDRNITETASIG